MDENKASREKTSSPQGGGADGIIDLVEVVAPAPAGNQGPPIDLVDVVHQPEDSEGIVDLTQVVDPGGPDAKPPPPPPEEADRPAGEEFPAGEEVAAALDAIADADDIGGEAIVDDMQEASLAEADIVTELEPDIPREAQFDAIVGETDTMETASLEASGPDPGQEATVTPDESGDLLPEESVAVEEPVAESTGEEAELELSEDVRSVFQDDTEASVELSEEEDENELAEEGAQGVAGEDSEQELMDLDDVFDEEIEKTMAQEDDELTNTLGLNLDPASGLSETFPDFKLETEKQDAQSIGAVDATELEAAIEAVIERKFGERIEKAVENIIREAVEREIAAIRKAILDETGREG
jgi:hypothetical protein